MGTCFSRSSIQWIESRWHKPLKMSFNIGVIRGPYKLPPCGDGAIDSQPTVITHASLRRVAWCRWRRFFRPNHELPREVERPELRPWSVVHMGRATFQAVQHLWFSTSKHSVPAPVRLQEPGTGSGSLTKDTPDEGVSGQSSKDSRYGRNAHGSIWQHHDWRKQPSAAAADFAVWMGISSNPNTPFKSIGFGSTPDP